MDKEGSWIEGITSNVPQHSRTTIVDNNYLIISKYLIEKILDVPNTRSDVRLR